MAKKARTEEEIKIIKQNILEKAVDLIVQDGYENFSMRKLAEKLKSSATAIYLYYPNKEELYLEILNYGFEEMTACILNETSKSDDPIEKLQLLAKACFEFGTTKANLYNIMFVDNFPKYIDFIGNPSERTARKEFDMAMAMKQIITDIVAPLSGITYDSSIPNNFAMFQYVCLFHGFVTFYNSKATDYLIEPVGQKNKEELLDTFLKNLIKKDRKIK